MLVGTPLLTFTCRDRAQLGHNCCQLPLWVSVLPFWSFSRWSLCPCDMEDCAFSFGAADLFRGVLDDLSAGLQTACKSQGRTGCFPCFLRMDGFHDPWGELK